MGALVDVDALIGLTVGMRLFVKIHGALSK